MTTEWKDSDEFFGWTNNTNEDYEHDGNWIIHTYNSYNNFQVEVFFYDADRNGLDKKWTSDLLRTNFDDLDYSVQCDMNRIANPHPDCEADITVNVTSMDFD